jgi:hypothetical protein
MKTKIKKDNCETQTSKSIPTNTTNTNREVNALLVFKRHENDEPIQTDDLFSSSGEMVYCEVYKAGGRSSQKDPGILLKQQENKLGKTYPWPDYEIIREGISVSKDKDALEKFYLEYPECKKYPVQNLEDGIQVKD